MPFEWNAALVRLVGDGEVNVARQPAIDFDEVRAMLLLLIHYLAPLRFICGDNGIRPNRIWTIDDGTAKVDGRRWIWAGSLPGAPCACIWRACHVANAYNSIGEKKKMAPRSASV